MFEEVDVVLAAVEKDDTVLEQVVEWKEVFTEERAARFNNDVFLDIDQHLRDLLTHAANNSASRGLQLRQACFDNVSLLAAFEVFAPLTDPLLPFQNQVG